MTDTGSTPMPAITHTLHGLFRDAGLPLPVGTPDLPVTGVSENSQAIDPGNIFVAIQGMRTDSHLFISDAIERGASAVLASREIPAYGAAPIIQVADTRDALGRLAHAWHGNPAARLCMIGVTGTNGKTTTTCLLETLLREAGRKPGVIGTVEYRFAGNAVAAAATTPAATKLAQLIAGMAGAGADSLAMEVSSHALDQKRVSGLLFDVAVFTNLTQDHLDYHGTRENYAEAKRLLFSRHLKLGGVAVFNLDDECGREFAGRHNGTAIGYGINSDAAVRATEISYSPSGAAFRLQWPGGDARVESPLLGSFNVYNVLAAFAGALGAGVPAETACAALARITPVPGRFEQVSAGQDFPVIVDYAHTPDALSNVLRHARGLGTGRLIVVFGCGGDRDRGKRPIMGGIAAELADRIIVTNDNPRSEQPEAIAAAVLDGAREGGADDARLSAILDRRQAIFDAIGEASAGDIVVIAGKGHEDYQQIGAQVLKFDDRQVAREALAARDTTRKDA